MSGKSGGGGRKGGKQEAMKYKKSWMLVKTERRSTHIVADVAGEQNIGFALGFIF